MRIPNSRTGRFLFACKGLLLLGGFIAFSFIEACHSVYYIANVIAEMTTKVGIFLTIIGSLSQLHLSTIVYPLPQGTKVIVVVALDGAAVVDRPEIGVSFAEIDTAKVIAKKLLHVSVPE